jgi:NitT/TauT family transport system substrate-binding protein
LFRHASIALALALLALLMGCAPAGSQPRERAPIRLGSYLWPGSYWIDVAWHHGWFAEEGLAVERVNTNLKYFASLDAVAKGQIDVMGFSQFDLVRYVASGHNLVGVAAIDYSEGAEALVARPGIRHLGDLHGKRVALRRGTYLEYLLTVVAERENLDLKRVTLLDMSEVDALQALKAGSVDAMLYWEPYCSDAVAAVNGERLFSTAEFPGLTYNVLSMRRAFLDSRPEDVAALVRVWQRAVKYMHDHPHESYSIVAEANQSTVPDVQALLRTDRILDPADNTRAFSYAAGFESLHGSWRRMNDFMLERSLARRRVDSPDHLDSRFIRALE